MLTTEKLLGLGNVCYFKVYYLNLEPIINQYVKKNKEEKNCQKLTWSHPSDHGLISTKCLVTYKSEREPLGLNIHKSQYGIK